MEKKIGEFVWPRRKLRKEYFIRNRERKKKMEYLIPVHVKNN
jgi:hypothetical protein